MPVNFIETPASQLLSIPGVRIGVAQAGIRKADRKDLTVFLLDEGSVVAAVFTQNKFCAAPVQVCREHLGQSRRAQQSIRALVINTGNANAGTGQLGLDHAQQTCQAVAERLHIDAEQVLPFSTGVIMESLPVDKLISGLDPAISNASPLHWSQAAQAIMTTDTVAKAFSVAVDVGGNRISVTGISKGAGMIRPNMATMLGFIATDACISSDALQVLAKEVADASFNRITVDGDTSTNDSLTLVATHKAGNAVINSWDSAEASALKSALLEVAQYLAKAIVRDGEGATKFITLEVSGGKTSQECLAVAYSIAHSPLVKTAFFASDPNLGRILAAVGYAGIADLDPTLVDMYLDEVHVATSGARHPAYQEKEGQRVMQQSEITIKVLLGRGAAVQTIWTCDLSHDYVTINADYRS